jgi:hypothetical protein
VAPEQGSWLTPLPVCRPAASGLNWRLLGAELLPDDLQADGSI